MPGRAGSRVVGACAWALVLAAALLVAAPASAVDPRASYFTLRTPHFRVHYAEGLYLEALQVARLSEEAWPRLVKQLGYEPSGITEIVMVDENDYAQGVAEAYPYRRVTVHPTVPDDAGSL